MIDPADLTHARNAIRTAKRLANTVRRKTSGRMDPEGLTWDKASELARAADDVAYHANWMLKELEGRLQ